MIAFGEEAVIPQLRDTITESAVSADAGRVMCPGSEETVRPQHSLEFGDRGATIHRRNISPKNARLCRMSASTV